MKKMHRGIKKILSWERIKMIKSALIIAPHPDDEINIAGTIIGQLVANDISVHIVFTTYGDYYPKVVQKRITEAMKVARVFKLLPSSYTFLGYGDGWKEKHIYHSADNPVISKAGKKESYGMAEIEDYRYKKSGYHSKYTKKHYLNDIKEVILSSLPELIICVDYDSHPDHRACSLIFEEALHDILVHKNDYTPIVLKKFAYLSVWKGPDDYFDGIPKESLPIDSKGNQVQWGCVPYDWNNRIRFKVPEELLRLDFWNNPIFKAANIYKSQQAKICFPRMVNTDATYWYRKTNSLTYKANITASTGNPKGLNDFKLIDSEEIMSNTQAYNSSQGCVWLPDENDKEPWISIELLHEEDVEEITIYQDMTSFGIGIKIEIDDHKVIGCYTLIEELCNRITFEKSIRCSKIKISIVENSAMARITEIEIYKDKLEFPWNEVPFEKYVDEVNGRRNSSICKMAKFLYSADVLMSLKAPKYFKRMVRNE